MILRVEVAWKPYFFGAKNHFLRFSSLLNLLRTSIQNTNETNKLILLSSSSTVGKKKKHWTKTTWIRGFWLACVQVRKAKTLLLLFLSRFSPSVSSSFVSGPHFRPHVVPNSAVCSDYETRWVFSRLYEEDSDDDDDGDGWWSTCVHMAQCVLGTGIGFRATTMMFYDERGKTA